MIFSVEMTIPLDRANTARRFRSSGESDTLTPDTRTSVGPSSEMSNIQTPIEGWPRYRDGGRLWWGRTLTPGVTGANDHRSLACRRIEHTHCSPAGHDP